MRVLTRAIVAGAAALALTSTAARADVVYPTQSDGSDATTFSDGSQQWTGAGTGCGILGIPVGCSVTNDYAGDAGNPSGSIRTRYTSTLNLLGLLTGNGKWRSPSFKVPASATIKGATFSVDHQLSADGGVTSVLGGLIPTGAQSQYSISLVDDAGGTPVVLDARTLTAAKTTFDRTGRVVAANELKAGHTYHLLIDTTQTATVLQAAIVNVTTNFDNVRLQVNDGSQNLNAPAGATTLDATDVTRDSATLNGSFDTHGLPTTYLFQYGDSPDAMTKTTPTRTDADPDGPAAKSEALTGLDTCKTIYFQALATNTKNTGAKPTLGGVQSLRTNCKPAAQTLDASPVTATTAGFNSAIDPGGETTTYHYEYGTSTAYGTSTPERTLSSKTSTSVPNQEPIAGLTPGTTYHVRVVATNAIDKSEGNDVTFATPAQSAPGATGSTGTPGTPGTPGTSGTTGPKGASGTGSSGNVTLQNGDSKALLRIRSKIARVGLKGARKAQIRLPIACSTKAIKTCAGTVKIRTVSKINPSSLGKKKAKRRVTLATFDYQLANGKSGIAIGRSTPEKLRLMRKLKSVKVEISVQVSDASGNGAKQTIVEKGTYKAQKTV